MPLFLIVEKNNMDFSMRIQSQLADVKIGITLKAF